VHVQMRQADPSDPARTVPYRPDIDGLRAIAVLAVLLFHLDIPRFSGGFVGVDIFFVISGFLIAALIARELAADRFSLAAFFERRIRRIFPALFAVVIAVTIVGSQLFLPTDFKRLGTSIVATTLFGSNLYFSQQSGYFGSNAAEVPLLHTWSLAVEEQYYIVFPLILAAIYRFRGARYTAPLLLMIAGSFVISVWMVRSMPTAAFYLPMSRAWEFLAGAVLGIGAIPAFGTMRQRSFAAVAGLLLIGWPIVTFSQATSFPGLNAVLPVAGSMLLLHAGDRQTFVASLLATAIPRQIGKISYSLYLWHWPIIVFWKYRTDTQWQPWEYAVVTLASFGSAALSWRFIEQPFRRSHPSGRRTAFRYALVAAGAICAMGVTLSRMQGFPSRMTPQVVALDAATRAMAHLPETCTGSAPARRRALCAIGTAGVAPSFLLWGDSHANAVLPAFEKAGRSLGLGGRIAFYPACPTLLGLDRLDQPARHDCSDFNDQVLATLRTMPSITTVFLVSRWGLCANGTRTEGGRPCYLGRRATDRQTFANDRLLFGQGLAATVRTLSAMGKTVVLVAPIPEFKASVPETLARAALFGTVPDLALRQHEYIERERIVLRDFAQLRRAFAVKVVYPHDVLCRKGACLAIADGIPLYADDDHLSRAGSLLLTDSVRDMLQASTRPVTRTARFQ
jgi:peptidoglycan/LPS O-acetylase OafA/YrhL